MKTQILVKSNKKRRTFTIRKNGSKYRTIAFSKEEFKSYLNNTENDWNYILRSENYYLVK
jgi:hypothetical protein